MTVACVREAEDHVEVMFFESARIYRLFHDNPAYGTTLHELRAAAASGSSVRVRLSAPRSDVIEGATLAH